MPLISSSGASASPSSHSPRLGCVPSTEHLVLGEGGQGTGKSEPTDPLQAWKPGCSVPLGHLCEQRTWASLGAPGCLTSAILSSYDFLQKYTAQHSL